MIIHGYVYPLRTDYRVGIAYFMDLLRRREMTVQRSVQLWFPEAIPPDLTAAQEAVTWFFRCGAEEKSGKTDAAPVSPAYAYDVDAEAIIAAFQREYGIDLTTSHLHWWRFCALLRGLLMHSFAERVRYRVCDTERIKSSEVRSECRKYRAQYALDQTGRPVEQPETLDAYNEMLLRIARGEVR